MIYYYYYFWHHFWGISQISFATWLYGHIKWNEMNRALGHLCAHIGWTGPGEPPEDGEMIEMTLSSRHRIRNSSPGGLRPSTLPLGQGGSPQYWLFTRGWGRNIFCFFQTAETGHRTPNSGVKGSGANHYPHYPQVPEWRHQLEFQGTRCRATVTWYTLLNPWSAEFFFY